MHSKKGIILNNLTAISNTKLQRRARFQEIHQKKKTQDFVHRNTKTGDYKINPDHKTMSNGQKL